jgi:CubicO group peptidase (beta-lactamase class C family)
MAVSGFATERLIRMQKVMSGFVERGEVPGMVTLVSRHGEVRVEAIGSKSVAGHDPMRRDTIFRIASLTKLITAAAAMILIEECRIRLGDPVEEFLPELGNRQVLKRMDSPLDDTVPAKRSLTVRDLLNFCMGFGSVMAAPGTYPIQKAIRDLKIGGDGPPVPDQAPSADQWIANLGSLPLIHQPGERWMYNTGSDVLGILIARASGKSFEEFLRERIFGPLGMKDTSFSVPADKLNRLATSYQYNPQTRQLEVYDDAIGSHWSHASSFQSGAGGLVSTADDYAAFCQMLLNKGKLGPQRILSRLSVELMTSDQITAEQRAGAEIFFASNSSWGFGGSVVTRQDDLANVPGRYGWTGGLGTSASVDPREDMIGILMTQRMMDSPDPPKVFLDFWTSAYQAMDD